MMSLFLYQLPLTLLSLFRSRFRFRFRFLFPFPFLFRIPVSGFSRRPLSGHRVNLPICVARRPLGHKVNLPRCICEARWRHLIMTCDIFGTRQTNTLTLCYLWGRTYKPAHSSATLDSLKSTRSTKLLEKLLTWATHTFYWRLWQG